MVIVAELQKLFWATAAFECSTFAVSKAYKACCEQPVITVML